MTSDHLDEYWDIYNHKMQIIGTKQRREQLDTGEYHLVVNAFIFNPAGKVLLQQRSSTKLNAPGKWDCSVGGSALKGETHLQAIKRECCEELGIQPKITEDTFYCRKFYQTWIEDWFSLILPEKATIHPDFIELQQARFFDLQAANHLLATTVAIDERQALAQAVRHLKR